jgi:hypothetical protein
MNRAKLFLSALLLAGGLAAACTIYTGDGPHHHPPDACDPDIIDGPPPIDGGFSVDAPLDAVTPWPEIDGPPPIDGGFSLDAGPGCEFDGGFSLDAAPEIDGGYSPDAGPCCPHPPDAGAQLDAPY